MKKLFPYKLFLLSIGIGLSVSSCQKMAGHSIVPSGGTGTSTGTTGGATFGTTTGTVTFTVQNVGSYNWTLPTYFMGLGTTPTTGIYSVSNTPSTIVTSGPADVNQFLNNAFSVSFSGTIAGRYPMSPIGSFVKLAGVTYSAAGGSETVTVSAENITVTSTSLGTVTGTAKGSFTGQMMNMTTLALVNVSGTFDVKL